MTTVLPFRAAAVSEARTRTRVPPRIGHRAVRRLLPLADGVVAFTIAAVVQPWGDVVGPNLAIGLVADAVLAVVWVGALAARGSYSAAELGERRSAHTFATAAVLPLVVLLVAAVRGSTLDAPRLVALTAAVAAASFTQHAAAEGARDRTRTVRTVVAGHPHGVRWMLDDLQATGRMSVVAICLTEPADGSDFAVPVVTGLGQLRACATEHRADAVVVVPCRHVESSQIRRLCWSLETSGSTCPDLLVTTGLPEVGGDRAQLAAVGPVPLVRIRPARTSGAARAAKQLGERAVAAACLVILAPLILLLAMLVRLESSGPAVFRQTRIGRGGVPFTMLKLRTMCADAAELQASLSARTPAELMLFKMHADPRITRLGRFLRTYSLDELPQLVNVVRGQMALVGPRPALPCEVERYDADTFRRLAVTPGMTGLWQVSGRSDLSWEESVRLDLRYVDDWTPGLDLRILARTAGAVVGHRGAY